MQESSQVIPVSVEEYCAGIIVGTHIIYLRAQNKEKGVTQVWRVFSKATSEMGHLIGEVKWFGRWRKYAYFPAPDTVYEEVCLREIAKFGEDLTKAHRASRKKGAKG